jgi:hypothetical protein
MLCNFVDSFDAERYFFHICTGVSADLSDDFLCEMKKRQNCNVSAISQKELKEIFPNYMDAHKKEHKDLCSKEEMLSMVGLLRKKLNGFNPDIILHFGALRAPALRELFPKAPLIFYEISILNSIGLYPKAWYLDVCGAQNYSFTSVFYKEILNIKIDNENKREFLNSIRKTYICTILKGTPLRREDLDPDKKFKYIVFLPLESSMQPNFFNHTGFITQFDLISYILDRLDPEIGLVVKEHVSGSKKNSLVKDGINYLRETYPNFIFIDKIKSSLCGSNFLLSLSDALITVSSTMGMQCLLWEKAFFVIGDLYIKHYADGSKIEEIKDILSQEYKSKDGALYYLLNHYYVPNEKFLDPQWMEGFFNKAIQRHNKIGFDFYTPIDTPGNILSFYLNNKKRIRVFKLLSMYERIEMRFPVFQHTKPLFFKVNAALKVIARVFKRHPSQASTS